MNKLAQRKNIDSNSLNSNFRNIEALAEFNMRDLIWLMNPDNASLENLIARIRGMLCQF
jgi:hypothetical protein